MPARINDWYTERGLPTPQDRPAMVRAIMESLAQAFADTVTTAAELSGRPVTAVHIVGGGSQNQLLCQLTADRIGAPLLAGPVEATALGNVLLTARAQSLISGGLDDLRALVAGNYSPRRYLPEKQGSAAQAQPVEVEMTRGGSQV
jgi:rhamnulokinase